MKYAFILLILSLSTESNMKKIYTFSNQTNIKEWRIVNDGVMGGISKSSLLLTDAGHGQFSGHVSLANNGGFASMQLNTTIKIEVFNIVRPQNLSGKIGLQPNGQVKKWVEGSSDL